MGMRYKVANPEAEPPWASRTRAITAKEPSGIRVQVQVGSRDQGSTSAPTVKARKMTPAATTSAVCPMGNGMSPIRMQSAPTAAKNGSCWRTEGFTVPRRPGASTDRPCLARLAGAGTGAGPAGHSSSRDR